MVQVQIQTTTQSAEFIPPQVKAILLLLFNKP